MHGKIRSRIMDFRVQNLNDRLSKRLGTKTTKGAVISEIAAGGPAQRAGLRVGDVITEVDSRPVKESADFTYYVWTQPVGTHVKVKVDRGGTDVSLDYELVEAKRDEQ